MIVIKSIAGKVLLNIPITRDAISHEELMTADYVQLSWTSDKGDILPLGAYIEHEGERYSLLEPYTPAMQNEVSFRYTPQFHSRIISWQKKILPVYTYGSDGETVASREFDWSFIGTPSDMMFMIQQALLHETGEEWSVILGEGLPETVSLSAQSAAIWDVLTDLADACETEWWVNKRNNTLYLSECKHGSSVSLEVGKNVGVPTVTANRDGYFTRFYAFGSSRNITQSDGVVQGSMLKKRLTLDPKKYPNGYKDIRGHFEDGVYVSDLSEGEVLVTSLYFEDVYPSSPLTISGVRKRMKYRQNEEGEKIKTGGTDENPVYEQYPIWYFKIDDFEFTEDLIIEGLTLSAAFKTGRLRGREFELAYHKEAKKVADKWDVDEQFSVEAGEYEIIFDELDGYLIPDEEYIIPSDGDEITLFNINMPEVYKDSARLELEKELDKAMAEVTRDNNSYEFSSNPIAFDKEIIDVSLGRAVSFVNGSQTLATRVLMVEKHLDYYNEQKIRVGNVKISSARQQLRDEVRNIGKDVNEMAENASSNSVVLRDHTRDLMLTMGRYFAMQDSLAMIQDAVDGFSSGISPVTVQTMAMLVGDESLQFRFIDTVSYDSLTPQIIYDPSIRQLRVARSYRIMHMTLGIDTITPQAGRDMNDYLKWTMPAWTSSMPYDGTIGYYLYARVSRTVGTGTYLLSKTPIDMKSEAGYYHLLIGILNKEYAGNREFVPLYGFTEVLPAQVTTDIVRSASGNLIIDLENATITAQNGAKISGDITIGSGSSGLTNLSEWSDKQKQIDDAQAAADNTQKALEETAEQLGKSIQEVAEIVDSVDAATKTLDSRIADVETGVNESVAEINARLDGVVENYFEEGVPTLTNYPASEWADENEKKNHIGDTYTNISSYDKDPDNAGKSWRWTFTDSEHTGYHWHPIADSDAVKALLEASKAKTTADGKSKTFVTQPVPPYKEGDLWVQGASGDIYRCKDGVDRTSGSYTASDWELASKYTDDTKADQAIEDAADAMDAAEKAQEVADAAKKVTDALNDDGIFTLVEKRGIRNALKEINPSEEDHVITRYYELTAVTNAGTGSWSEITDKADEDYGWYVSDMHSHNAYAVAKVTFNVLADCSVTMRIKAKSETQYDYVMLGDLDGTQLSTPTYTSSGIVANTMGKAAGEEVQHTFHAVEKGEHSVYVYYRKNLFTSEEPDNGYFRLDASPYLRGSLGDYLALCEKKGISGGNAEYYANDLFFSMYHTYKVWENNDSDLSSFEGYRDQMMMLFQYYYSSILEIQQSITQSDYDYLTQVFGKGNNLNVEGVVMSQMVAVRSEEDKVKAFLNGSDLGRDSEHGKLLIGAGVEDITKPEETKTRIYEDGTIISPLIKMLDGCRIGGKSIRIEDDNIVIDLASNGMKMTLSEQGLVTEGYSSATVGNCGGAAVQGFANGVYAFCPANTNPIGVQGEAKSGDYAFYSSSGMFAGLRPKTRVITTGGTSDERIALNVLDYSVLVTLTTGACYLGLPSAPQDGQEYHIETHGCTLSLRAANSTWMAAEKRVVPANNSFSLETDGIVRLKFYKQINQWQCSVM